MKSTFSDTRREFLCRVAVSGALVAASGGQAAESTPAATGQSDARSYWLTMLQRVAEPVLAHLAANQLIKQMPVECPAGKVEDRRKATHLEALGRTLCGIAPWLELDGKTGAEAALGQRLAGLARTGLANATDPGAADFLNFTASQQALVDAAFLAHALLRARRELWGKLEPAVQQRLIKALQSTRGIKPGRNNWLLFSAMVETLLAAVGAGWEEQPVETAVRMHEEWYKGDGAYGDGPEFHWDYYNSYVIHPMLLDVLEHMGRVTPRWAKLTDPVRRRARRYAAVQERLIAADGSYPVLGRSIIYRCGAFQLLAQMALRDELPEGVTPAQVRDALTAVIRRTLGAPGTFDADGWLQVGLAGHQPDLAENYISTGSLYLCAAVFLPLGLRPDHPFWKDPPADWTARKVWSGQNLKADHALR